MAIARIIAAAATTSAAAAVAVACWMMTFPREETFDGWPRWDSVTHQAIYEDWLHRAVEGGLRLMVMPAVNSEYMRTARSYGMVPDLSAGFERMGVTGKHLEPLLNSAAGYAALWAKAQRRSRHIDELLPALTLLR